MKKTEKVLISNLRKNGSRNILKIAKDNQIPKSTIFDTLRNLEKKQIVKHKSLINFEKIGFPIKIMFWFKTTLQDKSRMKLHFKKNKNVNSFYHVDSDYDFHVESLFRNLNEAYYFMNNLMENFEIIEMKFFHVLETVKHENFLTDESHFE